MVRHKNDNLDYCGQACVTVICYNNANIWQKWYAIRMTILSIVTRHVIWHQTMHRDHRGPISFMVNVTETIATQIEVTVRNNVQRM